VAAVILNRFIEILLCLVRSLMQTMPSGQVFQKSDTPREAGGLMGWAASKAVGLRV
jgi:hypothetical protein